MRVGPVEIVAIVVVAVVLFLLYSVRRTRVGVDVELSQLFHEPATAAPGPRAMAWAYGVLYTAGVDADGDRAYAVKVLRDAEPRLSAAAASAIVGRMLAG